MSHAVTQGHDILMSLNERLAVGAAQSGDPLLFYAGAVAALMGHIGAAIGGEAADAILEMIRPTVAEEIAKLERERAH